MLKQAASILQKWSHHGQVILLQLEQKIMLLLNTVLTPAPRAVELGDQRLFIFDAYLIDAVLITVQRQYTGVAIKAKAFDGIHHHVLAEKGVRVRSGVIGMGHGNLLRRAL